MEYNTFRESSTALSRANRYGDANWHWTIYHPESQIFVICASSPGRNKFTPLCYLAFHHPKYIRMFGFLKNVSFHQVNLEEVSDLRLPKYHDLSNFQVICIKSERDYYVVCEELALYEIATDEMQGDES